MGGEAGLWKLPGLAQTPAGRHKQLLTIDDMALLGFGPRTPQAIIALRNKRSSCPDAPCPRSPFAADDAAAGLPDVVCHHPRPCACRLVNLLPSGDDMLRHIG